MGVANVVLLELFCEKSVNLVLCPGNVSGEPHFFQLQGFDGDRVWCNPGNQARSGSLWVEGAYPLVDGAYAEGTV